MKKNRRVKQAKKEKTESEHLPAVRHRSLMHEMRGIHSDKDIKEALEMNAGFQSDTARMLRISPAALSKRIKNSEMLTQALIDIKEGKKDLAESTIHKQLRKGNVRDSKWYLERVGKDRGYVKRDEHLTANINAGGGVLLLPAPVSMSEWEALAEDWANAPHPGPDDDDVFDYDEDDRTIH